MTLRSLPVSSIASAVDTITGFEIRGAQSKPETLPAALRAFASFARLRQRCPWLYRVEAFYFEDDNKAAAIAVDHEKLPPAARDYDCPGGLAVMEIADLRRLVVN
jgi:hypothetical protein